MLLAVWLAVPAPPPPPTCLLFHVCTRSCLSEGGAAPVSRLHLLLQESEQFFTKATVFLLLLFF